MIDLHFGTDGIRGIYGESITDEAAYALGRALAQKGKLLVARDNRLSSPALAAALLGGAGNKASYLGVATTPCLYYLLTRSDADYGVMITASHNPPEHNGLKVFDKEGKLAERAREDIVRAMKKESACVTYRECTPQNERKKAYRDFIKETIGSLSNVRAVVDYAEGATCEYKDILPSLGADITPLHSLGDGSRINVDCGALHPRHLAKEVQSKHADIGFAVDGDGDRIVAVTKTGDILDGDAILYLLARKMLKEGRLPHRKIALTVMTNSGVLKSLTELGVTPVSCNVGDAAVVETMKCEGLALGGEQSGHIVLGEHLMTGDALLVGATLMKMIKEGEPIERPKELLVYPQCLINVPVRDKNVAYSDEVQSLAAAKKKALSYGRVLVRASGTEALVRVMVECPDAKVAETTAREIAEKVRLLGAK